MKIHSPHLLRQPHENIQCRKGTHKVQTQIIKAPWHRWLLHPFKMKKTDMLCALQSSTSSNFVCQLSTDMKRPTHRCPLVSTRHTELGPQYVCLRQQLKRHEKANTRVSLGFDTPHRVGTPVCVFETAVERRLVQLPLTLTLMTSAPSSWASFSRASCTTLGGKPALSATYVWQVFWASVEQVSSKFQASVEQVSSKYWVKSRAHIPPRNACKLYDAGREASALSNLHAVCVCACVCVCVCVGVCVCVCSSWHQWQRRHCAHTSAYWSPCTSPYTSHALVMY